MFVFDLIIAMLVISGIGMAGLGLYARRFTGKVATATPFILLMGCGAAWSFLYALDLLSPTLGWKIFFHDLRFLVLPFFSVIELWLVLAYVKRDEWLRRDRALLILIVPVAAALLGVTSQYHTLFRYNFSLGTAGPVPVLVYSESAFFSFYSFYSLALLVLAVILLITESRRQGSLLTVTTALLLVALAFPTLVTYLFQIFAFPFPGINLTPALLWIPAILYAIALFRYRFLEIIPIARSRLIEALGRPVLVLDTGGHVIDMNPAASSFFGVMTPGAPGATIGEMVTDWPEFIAFCRNGTARSQDLVRVREGRTEYYSVTAEPLLLPDGMFEGRLILLQDVTDLKAAEEALRASEEKSLLLLNSAAEAIYGIDMDGNCTFCNNACVVMLGYRSQDDLLGKNMHAQIHAKHADGSPYPVEECRIFKAFRKGEGSHVDDEVLWRKDGTSFPAEYWSYPQRSHGRVVGAVVTFFDITDRKEAERALRESADRLRQQSQDLALKVRELNCLYEIARLVETSATTEELLQAVAETLPSAWPYPDLTCARIIVGGNTFLSSGFEEKDSAGEARIVVHGKFTGKIEIFFREDSGSGRMPVAAGEADLLSAIAERLGRVVERKEVEAALQQSEEKYRAIIDEMQDIFYRTDRKGTIIMLSPSAARLAGYDSIDQLIGKDVTSVYADPADRNRLLAAMQETGAVYAFPLDLRVHDGSIRHVITSSHFYHDPRGNVLGVEGVIHDITNLRRAEDALRESEEKYRTLVESSFDGIAIHQDGILVYVNRTAARLLGSEDPGAFTGKPAIEIVAPAFRKQIAARVQQAPANTLALMREQFLRLDGTSIDVDVTTSPSTWKGRPAAYVTFRDITAQVHAERELRESEERYRTIISNLQDVYFRTDGEGRIMMVSPSAAGVFGFTGADEIVGRSILSFWKDPQIRAEMIEAMQQHGGEVREWEAEFTRNDGTLLWVSINARLLTGRDGAVQGTEGILRDITERRKMEEALKTALKKLNMLSSITRHDILNQIMGLRTFLELSREDLKGTKFETIIEKEDQAAEAIQRQIEFTRYYQDIGVNAPKWQDVRTVIGEAIGQLNLRAIDVRIAVQGIEIFADPLIVKVFFNLMENSLRHGERVSTMDFSFRESEAGLVITYRDNGVGITAEDKENLFRKGFGKHTGLGLFLSREILAITGIAITENGRPGEGVQFEITVPEGSYRMQAGPAA